MAVAVALKGSAAMRDVRISRRLPPAGSAYDVNGRGNWLRAPSGTTKGYYTDASERFWWSVPGAPHSAGIPDSTEVHHVRLRSGYRNDDAGVKGEKRPRSEGGTEERRD